MWPLGAWVVLRIPAWRSQDLPLLFPVPPSPQGMPAPSTLPLLGLPHNPTLSPAFFGILRLVLPYPAAPAPPGPLPPPHARFQSREALLASFPLPIHPSTHPNPSPSLTFSLPVLRSRIHPSFPKYFPSCPHFLT